MLLPSPPDRAAETPSSTPSSRPGASPQREDTSHPSACRHHPPGPAQARVPAPRRSRSYPRPALTATPRCPLRDRPPAPGKEAAPPQPTGPTAALTEPGPARLAEPRPALTHLRHRLPGQAAGGGAAGTRLVTSSGVRWGGAEGASLREHRCGGGVCGVGAWGREEKRCGRGQGRAGGRWRSHGSLVLSAITV